MVTQFDGFTFTFFVAPLCCFFHPSFFLSSLPVTSFVFGSCILQYLSLAFFAPIRFSCLSLASCDNLCRFETNPSPWFSFFFFEFLDGPRALMLKQLLFPSHCLYWLLAIFLILGCFSHLFFFYDDYVVAVRISNRQPHQFQ